jgi:uncharacterized protein YbbK (DUF523 family)
VTHVLFARKCEVNLRLHTATLQYLKERSCQSLILIQLSSSSGAHTVRKGVKSLQPAARKGGADDLERAPIGMPIPISRLSVQGRRWQLGSL